MQPIDLQAMYSQMPHIAQAVQHAQEGVLLANAVQAQNAINEKLEEDSKVAKTEAGNNTSKAIKNEKRGSDNNENLFDKKNNSQSENENENESEKIHTRIRESFIGEHIDIVR